MRQRRVLPEKGLEDTFKLDKMSQCCKKNELGNQLKRWACILKKEKDDCGKENWKEKGIQGKCNKQK